MSTCAGTSTEAEVGLEAGGRRRIASTSSMQRASCAPRHAKDKRDASNVIYPRRKAGQGMRNSNQVVVTAEILKQVKIPKSHLPQGRRRCHQHSLKKDNAKLTPLPRRQLLVRSRRILHP